MEIVSNFKIQKEKGFLYFVGRDGFVYKVPLNRSKIADKTPQRVSSEPVKIEKGYVYFIKDGYVCRAEQHKGYWTKKRKSAIQESQ